MDVRAIDIYETPTNNATVARRDYPQPRKQQLATLSYHASVCSVGGRMKLASLLWATYAIASLCSTFAVANAFLQHPSGLVSYLSFEEWGKREGEVIPDAMRNSLGGSIPFHATVIPPTPAAIDASAARFGMHGLRVSQGMGIAYRAPTSFSTRSEFTVSLWVKPSSSANTHAPAYVLSNAEERSLSGNHTMPAWRLMLHPGRSVRLEVRAQTAVAALGGYTCTEQAVLPTTTFSHVVVVYNGAGTFALYIDGATVGVPVSAGAVDTGSSLSSMWWFIGSTPMNDPPSSWESFVGCVDNLRGYDRALTPAEVETLFFTDAHTPVAKPLSLPPAFRANVRRLSSTSSLSPWFVRKGQLLFEGAVHYDGTGRRVALRGQLSSLVEDSTQNAPAVRPVDIAK